MRTLVLLVALAGCTTAPSAAFEPLSFPEAYAIAEGHSDGLRLVYVEGREWRDNGTLDVRRAEEARDHTNLTMRTADPVVGDGLAYTWWFRYVDPVEGGSTNIYVGPEGLLGTDTDKMSVEWIEARYDDAEIPPPNASFADLVVDLEPSFGDQASQGDAVMAVTIVAGTPHLLYVVGADDDKHSWVFDMQGRFLGQDSFYPAGWGMSGGAHFIEVSPLQSETRVLPVHGLHDEMVIALDAYAPFTTAAGHVFTLVATDPEGEQHTITLDVGVDEDRVVTTRVAAPVAGDWTFEVTMDRGATAGARVTMCAAGQHIDEELPACQAL